jgi:hypothetical protein
VDVLASNAQGTKAVTIQVKTNQSSKRAWLLSVKAETLVSETLFYVFVNLNGIGHAPTFHVVDSKIVAQHIREKHRGWISAPKRDGGKRKDISMRKFRDMEGAYLGAWHRLGLDGPRGR